MEQGSRRGIVDSLATGFSLITRRPYLILLPVLLDLLLQLSPGVSMASLAGRLADFLGQDADRFSPSPELLLRLQFQVDSFRQVAEQLNLLGILAWQLRTLSDIGTTGIWGQGLALQSWVGLLGVTALLAATAVLLGCLYLAPLGQLARTGSIDLALLRRHLARQWLSLGGYLLLMAVAGAIGALVAAVLLQLLVLTVPTLALAAALGFGMTALALSILLFFTDEAIFVLGVNPLRAVALSLRTAALNLWPTVGLFGLVYLIPLGTGLVWAQISGHPIGLAASVLGSAYISTGLAAGVMAFLWNRHEAPGIALASGR